MAYCQYCGTKLEDTARFCPNCGAARTGSTTQADPANTTAQSNAQWSNTARTVGTVAGVAVGASLLSRLFRPRPPRHPGPPMGPHHGPMGGPHHGPGGPVGGHGPMGGPGGRR